MKYYDKRKHFSYYKYINNMLSILSLGKTSIVDVGSNGVDILSLTDCEVKVSVDVLNPVVGPGIVSVKEDFFLYEQDRCFDLVTCFQVLEHIDDAKKFAQKLLALGKLVVVSVPFNWPKGMCKYHCQDPVDLNKLVCWFKKAPVFVQCVDTRMVAIFLSNDKDKLLSTVNHGNYAEIFNYSVDIGVRPKIDYTKFVHNEYKNLKIQNDCTLRRFERFSYPEMLESILNNTSSLCKEYFFAAMELYPFVLDKHHHPLFLKEYVRWLVDRGEFVVANDLLKSDLPSVRMMPTGWAIIIFARAYERHGMFDKALDLFSVLKPTEEVEQAISRIKSKIHL